MKINTEEMKKYAALSDEALWTKIKEIAGERGFKISSAQPSHDDLERVRSVLRGDIKFSLTDAMRLMKKYEKDGRV